MVAGIPGTGINGLFYLLLSALMPLEELPRTLRGRSSFARWRTLAYLMGMSLAVAGTLWGEYWLLERGVQFLHHRFSSETGGAGGIATAAAALAPALVITPFVVLGLVIVAVHALGVALRIGSAVATSRRAGAA